VVGLITESFSEPYYYVYGYESTDVNAAKATSNYAIYGVLYNWSAAMNGGVSSSTNPSGVQGACPEGWHLPSDSEWTAMMDFLISNGYNYDETILGNKLAKAMAATINWDKFSNDPGVPGNTDYPSFRNKSGFTALPGGERFINGVFSGIGNGGYWWNTTEEDSELATVYFISTSYSKVFRDYSYKEQGYSVRCVKD